MTRRGLLKVSAGAGVAAVPFGAPAAAGLSAATEEVTPFRLHIPDSALLDLRRRLASTRWPEREPVADGSQGARLEQVRGLARHWLTRYDWRRLEARLNRIGQFRTRLDGLGIHFLHVRSPHRNALPLLLTHGWPGSVVEFLDVIGPLTDPTAFGGRASDAFHVVVPSLPGFAFSDKPTQTGWNITRIAKAWADLMRRLGYDRYMAQGGDWGSFVTAELARLGPPEIVGIHLNFYALFDPPVVGEPTPEEKAALEKLEKFTTDGSGYFTEQSTRPQQVGYGLTDSPVGQAAWIYEKFAEWSDSDGVPENVFGYDKMLDDIMLYWLPATAASSARIYWENARSTPEPQEFTVPVGYSDFPNEIVPLPRVWAERIFKEKLVYYNKLDRGGHFAAFEQPVLFTEELRKYARLIR
jgi:pimeloyl-ACP methyl ester carboxylesterase